MAIKHAFTSAKPDGVDSTLVQPSNWNADHTIENGTITDAHVAAANKDGVAGTASMRTLGTGAQQAAAGDHDHDADYQPLGATLTDLAGRSIGASAGSDILDRDAADGRYGLSTLNRYSSILRQQAGLITALNGTRTIGTGSGDAIYFGKVPTGLASVDVRYRVASAQSAAAVTWSELAIAKGSCVPGANASLTVIGYADTTNVWDTTGQKTTTVNVDGGQTLDAGDDLWIIFAKASTQSPIFRGTTFGDDLQTGGQQTWPNTRPSTVVGSPTACTIHGGTTLTVWATVHI